MDIGKGDWVECVGHWPHIGLSLGSIWLCEGILDLGAGADDCYACGDRSPTLILRGLPCPELGGWCHCGFTLIYRPKASIIEALKIPPERAHADA
jgi:hypothetical protein